MHELGCYFTLLPSGCLYTVDIRETLPSSKLASAQMLLRFVLLKTRDFPNALKRKSMQCLPNPIITYKNYLQIELPPISFTKSKWSYMLATIVKGRQLRSNLWDNVILNPNTKTSGIYASLGQPLRAPLSSLSPIDRGDSKKCTIQVPIPWRARGA